MAGLDFCAVVGRIGDFPWNARKKLRAGPYLAATIVRLLLGSGLAIAMAQSSLVSSALGAISIGVAAPLIIEKLTQAGAAIAGPGDL